MKKVAIPYWLGRVSPVFDVAGSFLLVDFDGGVEVGRGELVVEAGGLPARTERLAAAGVEALICGALSRPSAAALEARGIEVFPNVCGDIECVLAAYAEGRLGERGFAMPGCGGQTRRRRGACRGHRGKGCGQARGL